MFVVFGGITFLLGVSGRESVTRVRSQPGTVG